MRRLLVAAILAALTAWLAATAASYAHNDHAGAYPRNAFFSHLVTFLHTVAR